MSEYNEMIQRLEALGQEYVSNFKEAYAIRRKCIESENIEIFSPKNVDALGIEIIAKNVEYYSNKLVKIVEAGYAENFKEAYAINRNWIEVKNLEIFSPKNVDALGIEIIANNRYYSNNLIKILEAGYVENFKEAY